jgi:Domain of unknown function (DUF4391)
MAELLQWPDAAKVDRLVPKQRLYAEASASAAVKQRFVDEVQRVRWAYKLGEESLRLAPGETVTEIQVFVIELKGSDLHNSLLVSIDRAIPSQVIFELRRETGRGAEQAMTAAYKRSGSKTKTAGYFRTAWIEADRPRVPLPPVLDMDGLYDQLLGGLLPYPMRPSEDLPAALERMSHIRSLAREISVLEKRVRAEAQFNRKVELRNQLRTRQADLDDLTKSEDPMIEDAAWKS